jgi:hypothetical protein
MELAAQLATLAAQPQSDSRDEQLRTVVSAINCAAP